MASANGHGTGLSFFKPPSLVFAHSSPQAFTMLCSQQVQVVNRLLTSSCKSLIELLSIIIPRIPSTDWPQRSANAVLGVMMVVTCSMGSVVANRIGLKNALIFGTTG